MGSTDNRILAIVTTDSSKVGGGAPIFFVNNQEEMVEMANFLARILMAAVHDLNNGMYILVRH